MVRLTAYGPAQHRSHPLVLGKVIMAPSYFIYFHHHPPESIISVSSSCVQSSRRRQARERDSPSLAVPLSSAAALPAHDTAATPSQGWIGHTPIHAKSLFLQPLALSSGQPDSAQDTKSPREGGQHRTVRRPPHRRHAAVQLQRQGSAGAPAHGGANHTTRQAVLWPSRTLLRPPAVSGRHAGGARLRPGRWRRRTRRGGDAE